MSLPAGGARDWDDLIAALAAHDMLTRLFAPASVDEATRNVRRAAARCGWAPSRGELFAWAERMVGHYRNLAPGPNGRRTDGRHP